ncbi:MAG: polysaccharide biosynthesis protein [Casimicrobiaceae bacterium]
MTLPFNWRAALAFAHDVCVTAIAWIAIYWLRFNLDLRQPFADEMWSTLVWIVPLQATIFVSLGLYRGLWRFASLADLQRIMLAAGLGAIMIPLLLVMLKQQTVVPRSVLFFYPIVLILLMTGSRFVYRIWKEHRLYSPLVALGEPVRIVDLARDMIRLYGADPDRIAIVFTGLRPGEKLYEEPLASEEETRATTHPKLRIALARPANPDAIRQLVAWCERDRVADDGEVRARMQVWIPEYAPPAGASIKPFPVESEADPVAVPLRAPRRR